MTILDVAVGQPRLAFAKNRRSSRLKNQPTTAIDRRDDNPLARLVQLSQSNDRLLAQLEVARTRLDQAVDYASDPRSRIDLGAALVRLARRKCDRVLDQLRANRFDAVAVLAKLAL